MAFFRGPVFGPGWSAADPNLGLFTCRFPDREMLSSGVGMNDRGGLTTISFPLTKQHMEPVRLNTNLLLREPFAVAMDDMDDHYMIYIYQPNMRKKDISMTLLGDVLTIHGSRHLRGVSYELSRELALPPDADVSQLQAEFMSGRIDVKIPKISHRRAYRSIPIGGIQPTRSSIDTETKEKKQAPVPKPTPSPRRNIPIAGVTTQDTEEQPSTTPQQQVKLKGKTDTPTDTSHAGSGSAQSTEHSETVEPSPTQSPSPRRNIPIGGTSTEPASLAKTAPSSMEPESQQLMPPPSLTQPTPSTTPTTHIASERESKLPTRHETEEIQPHPTQATSKDTEHQPKQPTSSHTLATRECEPFPGVDVGGIPEPEPEPEPKPKSADIGTTNTAPSTTTESSPVLESDVSMTGHDISVAKRHATEEKHSHELEHDIQHHQSHHHHHPEKVTETKHDEPSQATDTKPQPEKPTEHKQDEESPIKQSSIISRVVDVAKKATDVVRGTGSAQE